MYVPKSSAEVSGALAYVFKCLAPGGSVEIHSSDDAIKGAAQTALLLGGYVDVTGSGGKKPQWEVGAAASVSLPKPTQVSTTHTHT